MAIDLDALEPCPFCGSAEVSYYVEGGANVTSEWFIRCHGCCVETARQDSRAEAITEWNRRTPPAQTTPVEGQSVRYAEVFDALRHLAHNIKATGKRLDLGVAMDVANAIIKDEAYAPK